MELSAISLGMCGLQLQSGVAPPQSSLFTALDASGAAYAINNPVLDASESSYTITATAQDAAGNSYNLI